MSQLSHHKAHKARTKKNEVPKIQSTRSLLARTWARLLDGGWARKSAIFRHPPSSLSAHTHLCAHRRADSRHAQRLPGNTSRSRAARDVATPRRARPRRRPERQCVLHRRRRIKNRPVGGAPYRVPRAQARRLRRSASPRGDRLAHGRRRDLLRSRGLRGRGRRARRCLCRRRR